MSKQKVYLAGGMRSRWQDEVRGTMMGVDAETYRTTMWLDQEPFIWSERVDFKDRKWTSAEYTQLDLHLIKKADIVFAYLEKDNPGLGMIAECGYAIRLGKTVILVRESPHEVHKDRYVDFLEEMCTISFDNLEDGINYLTTFK